jgi:DNA polymerase III delta subunit
MLHWIKLWRDFLGDAADDPQAKEVLYADEKPDDGCLVGALAVEKCESSSLFCPNRVVIIRNAHKLLKADQEELLAYFKSPNPTNALFIEAEKLDARSAFAKAIPKPKGQKSHAKYDRLKDYQIPEWITNHCKELYHKRISKMSSEYLRDLIGADTSILDQELKKLSQLIGEQKEITYEDIKKHVAAQRPATAFDLMEPFGLRDAKHFFNILPFVLSNGVPEFLIVVQLYRHTAKLMRIKEMLNQRIAVAQIAEEMGAGSAFIFSKVQKLDVQAPKRELERYRQILLLLAEMEHQCKTGYYQNTPQFETALMSLF